MPTFYFHVFDGRAVLDTDGAEFESQQAARIEAIRLAGAMLRDEAGRVAAGEAWHMEVTDRRGLMLFRLDFALSAADAARTVLPAAGERSEHGPPRAPRG